MTDEAADGAWGEFRDSDDYAPTDRYPARDVFMAGRESRDAEVAEFLRNSLAERGALLAKLAAAEAALKLAGEAWDMTHFSCDNPDHAAAYKLAAPAFLDPRSHDSSTTEGES